MTYEEGYHFVSIPPLKIDGKKVSVRTNIPDVFFVISTNSVVCQTADFPFNFFKLNAKGNDIGTGLLFPLPPHLKGIDSFQLFSRIIADFAEINFYEPSLVKTYPLLDFLSGYNIPFSLKGNYTNFHRLKPLDTETITKFMKINEMAHENSLLTTLETFNENQLKVFQAKIEEILKYRTGLASQTMNLLLNDVKPFVTMIENLLLVVRSELSEMRKEHQFQVSIMYPIFRKLRMQNLLFEKCIFIDKKRESVELIIKPITISTSDVAQKIRMALRYFNLY